MLDFDSNQLQNLTCVSDICRRTKSTRGIKISKLKIVMFGIGIPMQSKYLSFSDRNTECNNLIPLQPILHEYVDLNHYYFSRFSFFSDICIEKWRKDRIHYYTGTGEKQIYV